MLRYRQADRADMNNIFLMGYDVWGDGIPIKEYITQQTSTINKEGTWFVLEDMETGNLLSSLVLYQLNSAKNLVVKGVGSVATSPAFRKKGYASLLIKKLLNDLKNKTDCDLVFLYSDIGAPFYEALNFKKVASFKQKYQGHVCMYYSMQGNVDPISLIIPDYF